MMRVLVALSSSGFTRTHLDINQQTEEIRENCLYKNHPQNKVKSKVQQMCTKHK